MTDRLLELKGDQLNLINSLGQPVPDDAGSEVASSVDLESQLTSAFDSPSRAAFQKYERESAAINQAIQKIEESNRIIEEKLRFVNDGGIGEEVRKGYQEEIERCVENSRGRSKAIRGRLKRIAGENEAFAEEFRGKRGDIRVRTNQLQGLTRRFMAAMKVFEEVVNRYRENARKVMKRRLEGLVPNANEIAVDEAVEKGDLSRIIEQTQMQSQLPVAERQRMQRGIEELRSRNKDLKKLEGDIEELHQLFTDMQLLVNMQGDLLNNIEKNVEETKEGTKAAHTELVQAREHQKSAKKKKIWLIILIIVLLAVVLVPVLVTQIPIWTKKKTPVVENEGEPGRTFE